MLFRSDFDFEENFLVGLGAGLSDFGRRLAKDLAKAFEKRALVRAQRVKLSLKPSASRRWLLERERTLHPIRQYGCLEMLHFVQHDSRFIYHQAWLVLL